MLPLVVIGVGLWLWWPPYLAPDRSSDLGANMVGGGIVASVVLYLDQILTQRQEKNLTRLQLGSEGGHLPGIDLSNEDLAGFHLVNRSFAGGSLRGADLRGAVLQGCNLDDVHLDKADLRGADLSNPYRCSGISLEGALYDASTRWPDNIAYRELGAINLDEQGIWRKLRQGVKDRGSDLFR